MMNKRSGLGRGLGALIDDAEIVKEQGSSSISEIEMSKIVANPYQPRTKFDEEALKELATSIKEIGIIQPITLRKVDDDKYQIIAGERRFRASKMAGLKTIPAFVRVANDEAMLEMALVENIQREDLDAIEVALSYQRLIDECSMTQETLGDRVGKKRSTVTNYLRLLKLPAIIQKGIVEKSISMGHARALISVNDPEAQIMIYEQILKYDFSVRKVEEFVRNLSQEAADKKAQNEADDARTRFPNEYEDLKKHLSKYFKTSIDFSMNDKGKGKIVIPFKSPIELERILAILDKIEA